jgi:hypothetical protein
MRSLKARSAVGIVAVLLLMAANATAQMTPTELLAVLRARDAQFDNVSLRYTYWGEEKVKLPSSASSGDAPVLDTGSGSLVLVPYQLDGRVTVRGPNVTFERGPNSLKTDPADRAVEFIPYAKSSNTQGKARGLVDGLGGPVSRFMYVQDFDGGSSLVAEKLMEVEFGFGFGFGKRIKEISSVKYDGPDLLVEGRISLWRDDLSRFTIKLDDDFVVREAMIDTEVGGLLTRRQVDTKGSMHREGFVFAKEGHFMRIRQGFREEGEITGEPEVQAEFRLRFDDIEFALSDADYARLSNMDVPPETVVIDHTSGDRLYVDKHGQTRPLDELAGASFITPNSGRWRFYVGVVLLHALVFSLVLLIRIVWRRRRA